MTVSENAVPAVGVFGVLSTKVLAEPVPVTVKVPEVPVAEPWLAVSVVVWALNSVTVAVPTPFAKVTVEG